RAREGVAVHLLERADVRDAALVPLAQSRGARSMERLRPAAGGAVLPGSGEPARVGIAFDRVPCLRSVLGHRAPPLGFVPTRAIESRHQGSSPTRALRSPRRAATRGLPRRTRGCYDP